MKKIWAFPLALTIFACNSGEKKSENGDKGLS